MGEIQTSLGERYSLERRLPPLGWRPTRRKVGKTEDLLEAADIANIGDDFGFLAVIGLVAIIIVAALILVPLLLFVAEVALVVALIVPLTILALTLGVKRHMVLITRTSDGKVVDTRDVRGVVGSVTAARDLKAAAHAGAYRR